MMRQVKHSIARSPVTFSPVSRLLADRRTEMGLTMGVDEVEGAGDGAAYHAGGDEAEEYFRADPAISGDSV